MGKQLTKSEVIEALQASRGMVTVAATKLGCTPVTIYNWIKKSPDCRAVVDQERERVIDTAELGLMKAINQQESWAIAFALKTIGKKRGYVERVENVTLNADAETIKRFLAAVEAAGISPGDALEAFVQELANAQPATSRTTGGDTG